MLVIEIMPFVSLLPAVHYRVGVSLLAAGSVPADRWFAAYSIRCPIDQTRRSQGEARSQLHPANSEFPAEATSLLDHEIGPACADYSSTRPCFVESKPTDSRQRTIQEKRTTRAVRFRPKPSFDSGDSNSASCPLTDLVDGQAKRAELGGEQPFVRCPSDHQSVGGPLLQNLNFAERAL